MTRSTLLALCGLALVAGARPAAAADDGYDNVLSSVATAVGLMKADESPEIDYRERAPLVLPPKMDLVSPSQTAARPASWPQDPDVARRSRAAADARAPLANILGNSRNSLSKEELMQGRVKASDDGHIPDIGQRYAQCGQNGNKCLHVSPDALAAENEHYKATDPDAAAANLKAGQEEARTYLTQPPTGYMKASRILKATTEPPKVYNRNTNHFEAPKSISDE